MKKILLIGAGRSTTSLIQYLKNCCVPNSWSLTIGDYNLDQANLLLGDFELGRSLRLDVFNQDQLRKEIEDHDIVVSMVPAQLHFLVAKECVDAQKNLVTASYISDSIQALDQEAIQKNVLILMECGLDPGIDHMSAMKCIHEIKARGGVIKSFKSYTGGLVAPESDTNPWHYKITWNPRNVVLAGQDGVVKFKQNNLLKFIPYTSLFKRKELIEIEGLGTLEAYPNRDSLKYAEIYGLEDCPSILRGTLRGLGFCDGWDVMVSLGLTDDSYVIDELEGVKLIDFLNKFLDVRKGKSVEDRFLNSIKTDNKKAVFDLFSYLGLFSSEIIKLEKGSPAQVLQSILEEKWKLSPEDKDMIVMRHVLDYEISGKKYCRETTLVIKGEDERHTSMSKTVGLPLGIVVEKILKGEILLKGVHRPTMPEVYNSVLKELNINGISFLEEEK